jgi:hypothetical protein
MRPARLKVLWLAGLVVGAAVVGGIAFHLLRPAAPHQDIRSFLESYFSDWSAGDLAAYRSHFDPAARIALVRQGEIVYVAPLDPFLDEEASLLRASATPVVERMTTFTADADATAAQAAAGWELRKGSETTTGVDRFTLIRDPQGQWKILFLVFYQ